MDEVRYGLGRLDRNLGSGFCGIIDSHVLDVRSWMAWLSSRLEDSRSCKNNIIV